MASWDVFEWDEAKRALNRAKHGVDFELARSLDRDVALIQPDLRRDYGEDRFQATGPIGTRLYVMIYTLRTDTSAGRDIVRVISLRKANDREVLRYESETEIDSPDA
ncbi:BrnT family toxin [Jiella sonneratiae]|uniref:BrnT family toxin n=1 Tax=Jiella sonneratiae TaxID=2816856 RepID=A0ABS3J8W7_9HYPH|nr:BrnT family toxin [Jiella sonneratiae]MBO0905557.1 BrnT family toxin [Jiella sonneratiae]